MRGQEAERRYQERRQRLEEWARQRERRLRYCRCKRPIRRRSYLRRWWCLRCGKLRERWPS